MPTVKETLTKQKPSLKGASLVNRYISNSFFRTRSRIIEDLKLRQLPPAQSRTYRLDEQSVEQDEERLILLLPVTSIHLLTSSNHPGHEISAAMHFFSLSFRAPDCRSRRFQVVCLSGWLFTLWNLTLSSFSKRL